MVITEFWRAVHIIIIVTANMQTDMGSIFISHKLDYNIFPVSCIWFSQSNDNFVNYVVTKQIKWRKIKWKFNTPLLKRLVQEQILCLFSELEASMDWSTALFQANSVNYKNFILIIMRKIFFHNCIYAGRRHIDLNLIYPRSFLHW